MIMKLLKLIFFGNDWMTIWSDSGSWDIYYATGDTTYNESCFWEIQYSKIRNKYRLKESGYEPNSHSGKKAALAELVRLNLQLKGEVI